MVEQAPTTDEQRAQVDALTRAAGFAVDRFVIDNRSGLAECTQASQTSLIVRAAVAYLVSQGGLIRVVPEDEWPEWLNVDLPDYMRAHLDRHLEEAVTFARRMNKAARRS